MNDKDKPRSKFRAITAIVVPVMTPVRKQIKVTTKPFSWENFLCDDLCLFFYQDIKETVRTVTAYFDIICSLSVYVIGKI